MTKTIRITALDNLYFGDGRPFTMGDDSWAYSIFPPHPSTVYGMLRSVYYIHNNCTSREEIDKATQKFKILYYGLEKYNNQNKTGERLFPLPKDYVVTKNDGAMPLELKKNDNLTSNYNLSHKLLFNGGKATNEPNHYIAEKQFIAYLKGESITESVDLNKFTMLEPEIGINRNIHSHITENLYRIPFIGLCADSNGETIINMLVGHEGIDLPENSINRFGGEGKIVHYESFYTDNAYGIEELNGDFKDNTDIIKMHIATSGIFEQGWRPNVLNDVEIIAAAIGTPHSIGGWDFVERKPKPMRKAVPAGSVYYFKGCKNKMEKIIDMNGKSIQSHEKYPNCENEGYGLVYFSKYRKQ